jgi:cell division transport system ATP-binding protein
MILLDRVTKTYPGDEEPALDNISLHIEPHEFVFLVGKSGAGKSTLIKMITKEEQPDSGKIVIGGIDLDYVRRRHIPHYRRRLGVVFQDYKLLPTRTVFENVAFALEIAGMSNREINKTVPKVLDLVGLENKANKFPTTLSGGERQRVSIARSVARQPKILIADEPTGNLDKLTRQEIIELLQKINDFGTTLLVTTHDENIVNDLGKRVVTLKAGRIVDDQKYHGVYRLDSAPEPEVIPEPEQPLIISQQPIIQRVASLNSRPNGRPKNNQRLTSSLQYTMKIDHKANHSTIPSNPKTAPKPVNNPAKAQKNQSKPAPAQVKPEPAPQKPATPPKKYARDSANQWYTASKPLKAAPKLSNLSLGQTVKLKPAPSIKQAVASRKNLPKNEQKRVI